MNRIIKHILIATVYAVAGTFITGMYIYMAHLQDRPDLFSWHKVMLEAQYSDENSEVTTFGAYRALEDRVFKELDNEVYLDSDKPDWHLLNRFSRSSLSDPESRQVNWNRSFELTVDKPKAKALLLHGLSDSPYSLRAMAEKLHSQGVWVVGLRIPGHGTAPSGLVKATWHDFAAATRLAINYLNDKEDEGIPFYIVGYSNGAALAVEYSLAVLEGEASPLPDKLLLISPAIGVAEVAKYAVWQSRLAAITGLEKFAWNSIQPEFDPYKYNSFAVNAGDQMFQLTQAISARISRLDTASGVQGFPPILAFQSVVDATVIPTALIDKLFSRLAVGDHELVLFDIDRRSEVEPFLKSDPEQMTRVLMGEQKLNFSVSLMTNKNSGTKEMHVEQKAALSSDVYTQASTLTWPNGVFALSHVSLPFPDDDPLYGSNVDKDINSLQLGVVEFRGENGLLTVPQNQLTRLRFNPFYPYLEQRTLNFFGFQTTIIGD